MPALPVLLESPRTVMALPPTVIGISMFTSPCVPPSSESLPVVVTGAAAMGAASAGAASAGAGADPDCSESPRTLMALPDTSIGTATSTMAWVPDATPSSPEVDASAAGATGSSAGAAGAASGAELAELAELVASPTMLIALPDRSTGTSRPTTAWVPESRPSSPEVVSAALAAAAPRHERPPTKRVKYSPL
jgi:hypothetical protein